MAQDDSWYDRVKVFVEIVALITASYLAFVNFRLKDEPTFKNSPRLKSTLTVDTVLGKMHLSYFASVENHGKSSFEISTPVVAKVWLIPLKVLTKDTSFDWVSYIKHTSADDTAVCSSYNNDYAPDQLIDNSFDFFLAKRKQYAVLVAAFFEFKSSSLLHSGEPWQDTTYDVKINVDSALWGKIKKPSIASARVPRLLHNPVGK